MIFTTEYTLSIINVGKYECKNFIFLIEHKQNVEATSLQLKIEKAPNRDQGGKGSLIG